MIARLVPRRSATPLRVVALAAVLAGLAAPRAFGASGAVIGADVSSLPAVEAAGAVFSDSGRAGDALAILAVRGLGAVRLRVWVDPATAEGDVSTALALARRAKALGLAVMLDLHYSDTWADPAHQLPPRRWAAVHGRALEDSVRAWTRTTLTRFVSAGVPPAAVQIGNEVTNGMLWPEGRLTNAGSRAEWRRFAALLSAAARGVRESAPGTRVLVHVDRGGDAAFVRRFFARLDAARVPYDDVALSYYPWWHGSLDALAATLRACDESLHRDVWVVETAHPWTSGWFDDTHNVVGAGARSPDAFAMSPEGQHAFAVALLALVRRAPRLRGVFWWEPADIAAPRRGSAWENCALFDEKGELLPAAREWRGARGR